MTKRLTFADIKPLSVALRNARVAIEATQAEMAEHLGLSRKTYVLLETSRWYPPYKHHARMIKDLHVIDPALVPVFLNVTGATLEEHVLVVQAPEPRAPSMSAEAVKAAYDTAVAEVAAERDMTVGAVRKVAAALVPRLAEAGLAIGDVARVARVPTRA